MLVVGPRWQGKRSALAEEVCATECAGLFGAADDAGTEVAVGGVSGKATDGSGVKVVAAGGVGFLGAADGAGFGMAGAAREMRLMWALPLV